MENISQHITYAEATNSQTALRKGIANIPGPAELGAMRLVAARVFEPLREKFGPLKVSSFYRCPRLNSAIGGAPTSQHCKGEAIDIQGTNNAELFNYVRQNLDFDQLIWEFSDATGNPAWVHVSFTAGKNRKQVLKAVKVKGKTVYEHY